MCTSGQDSGQAVVIGQAGVLDAACTNVTAVATPPVPVARSVLAPSPVPRHFHHALGLAVAYASADAGCAH